MSFTQNNLFETELKKRIIEEIERLRDILDVGVAIKDYADYKFHSGQILALRRVADSYCDEIQTLINKRS